MKAILNFCKITVPKTSAQPEDWEIDSEIVKEVDRRIRMKTKDITAKQIQTMLETEVAISDCLVLVTLCELGWARGQIRLSRFLRKQSELEQKYIKKHGGTIVLGAEKGSDEWVRKEDMLEDLIRYLQSYGFDYNKFVEGIRNNEQ